MGKQRIDESSFPQKPEPRPAQQPGRVVRREEHKLKRGSIWIEFVEGFTPPCSPDLIRLELLGGYRLKVWFKNGESGEVDISDMFELDGVFEPLNDLEFFRQVRINPEVFVLEWPNGADIDPEILYSAATGKPIRCRQWRDGEFANYMESRSQSSV